MRSEIHLRRKYGISYHPFLGILRYSTKICFYCLTLRRDRLINSLGRLIGIFDSILDRSPRRPEPRLRRLRLLTRELRCPIFVS